MTESETAKSRRIPERIGPYEIVRELGSGGMAQTFEAVRRKPGGFEKRVCVKRVLYPHSADPSFREEFMLEARVLAQVNHVGIVDAYDYDEDDGHWYIVMELVDGIDFAKLLDHYAHVGRRLPPHVAAYVIARAARALHYLHNFVDANGIALNIIHRDVSPQNILISRYGYVKLSDLGIATFVGRPKLTLTNHTKGKLYYSSPEQIDPTRGIEARSDLFSLGVVLYEALAGATPFQNSTQLATHHAILEGRFEPLLRRAPHLDPELAHLVERTLSPNKDERPSSCLEFALSLQTLTPHPDPEAALAAGVAEALGQDAPSPSRAASATYFTGDPMRKALEMAAAFRDPARSTSADTAHARTKPRQRAEMSAATGARPDTASTAPQSAPRGPQLPKWVIALMVVASLGTAGAWFALPKTKGKTVPAASLAAKPPPPAAPATAPRPEPAAVPVTAADQPEPTTSDSTSAANDTSPTDEARDERSRRKATTGALKVRVINWGYVWIDGVFKGKGPIYVDKLTPGMHDVGAAQVTDKPARTEKVRVTSGGFVEHVIRLNEEMFR